MKAMILAAGLGTRMAPLTHSVTKAMMPIANKPNLEHILDLCKSHNIVDIVMNLYHLPEQIDNHFKDGSDFGLSIKYSLENKLFGTAGSVKRISSHFTDTFIVMMGDGLTNIDLTEMIEFHKKNKSLATIAVKEVTDPTKYGIVVCNNQNEISSFQEKPSKDEAKSNLANIGIYIFEPEILELIPPKQIYDFGSQLFPALLEKGLPFYSYNTSANWYDIGNLEEYHKINMEIAKGEISGYSNNNAQPTSILLGNNVTIKSGVKLEAPLVIGNNVVIEKNAILKNSIVLDNTHIGDGIEIADSIVCQNSYINITNNFATIIDDPDVLKSSDKVSAAAKFSKLLMMFTDRTVALIALLLLAPLFLIVAFLIKLDSPGPILYKSVRTRKPEEETRGKHWYSFNKGKLINYYVFRTMFTDTSSQIKNLENKYEDGPYVKVNNDPRITRVGKILRKTSIDELPLLWNVLTGNMSLVGIWALPTYEAEYIKTKGLKSAKASNGFDLSDVAKLRFDGKLGLAGFWQSRGRSNLSAEERALHDSYQAVFQNPSITDEKFLGEYSKYSGYKQYLGILIETFKSVVLRTGAM